MGVTRAGRFAALTNFRDPAQNAAAHLRAASWWRNFLTGSKPPQDYLERIAAEGSAYNGYNLLAGDGESLWWSSNMARRAAAPGAGRLWRLQPSARHAVAKSRRRQVGAGAGASDAPPTMIGPCLTCCRTMAFIPMSSLPQTGVPLEWERLLSAAFVVAGLRHAHSTVLCIGNDGWTSFDEQTWLPGAKPASGCATGLA